MLYSNKNKIIAILIIVFLIVGLGVCTIFKIKAEKAKTEMNKTEKQTIKTIKPKEKKVTKEDLEKEATTSSDATTTSTVETTPSGVSILEGTWKLTTKTDETIVVIGSKDIDVKVFDNETQGVSTSKYTYTPSADLKSLMLVPEGDTTGTVESLTLSDDSKTLTFLGVTLKREEPSIGDKTGIYD